MNIFFDIETIPTQRQKLADYICENIKAPSNYKDPEKIQTYIEEKKGYAVNETSLNGTFGEIISIACALDDRPVQVFYREDWRHPERETEILTEFFKYLDDNFHRQNDLPPLFIGHNIANFDLRFIYQRAVVNRVKPFAYFPIATKSWDKSIFDTMLKWSDKNYISMNELCVALNIPPKDDDIDGSKVWEFVQANRIREVAAYNKADVERTRLIYKKLTFKDN